MAWGGGHYAGRVHTVTIDLPTCTGSVLDHGAHVLTWQPRGADPVLFTSSKAIFAEGVAIRGGVPVCFPWFGPGREPGAPFGHGFARTSAWTLIGNEVTDETQQVTYRLSHPSASDDYWPHEYWALLTASFGRELTISLTVTNLDDHPISYEAALHTYLAVDSVREARIEGLAGVSYVDKTADGQLAEQRGALTFTGETDRVYATPGPVTVVDEAGAREISVATSGATHLIVWNPGAEQAAGLADLGAGEWERFVCVEAGRVLDGAVVLAPGETHTLATTISL